MKREVTAKCIRCGVERTVWTAVADGIHKLICPHDKEVTHHKITTTTGDKIIHLRQLTHHRGPANLERNHD